MYYYAVFTHPAGHNLGDRVFAYGGREEAIALARGQLTDPEYPLVSCERCVFG